MFVSSKPNFFQKLNYAIRYKQAFDAYKKLPQLSSQELSLLSQLKDDGFIILEGLISPDVLRRMQAEFQVSLQSLNFKEPCFSQALVKPEKHKELIDSFFYASDDELEANNLTFRRRDVSSLQEAIEKFHPSTLTVSMLENSALYRSVWFDERLLRLVAAYMGMVPKLTEAYVRRNFPAPYKVMNHFWHRDLNHKHYLLKVFVFLSDCDLENGPHEYIAGTHSRFDHLNGKRYFDDAEVNLIYPESSRHRIVSRVKAGTIIIEDTRGLHRAKMPVSGYRDLGFAVFMPDCKQSSFKLRRESVATLTGFQKKFLAKETII